MLAAQHQGRLRYLALLIGVPWFLYWGHSAYVSLKARDEAQAAWFKAEQQRDWTLAYVHEQERLKAAEMLLRAVAWGFFLPLAVLVAAELDAGIRRVTTQDGK